MTADAPAPASAALSTTLNKGAIILGALEQRENAAVPLTLELHPPPQPVPRRKRPFLLRRPPAAPPPPAEAPVVLDGFVLLETCRVEDPEEAERAVLEGCSISAVVGEVHQISSDPAAGERLEAALGELHGKLEALAGGAGGLRRQQLEAQLEECSPEGGTRAWSEVSENTPPSFNA